MLFRTRKAKTTVTKTDTKHARAARSAALTRATGSAIESLEGRTLLSTWSLQDTQIGLDKAAANYPTINGAGQALVVIDVGGTDYNHYALGSGYGNKVVFAKDFNTGSWDVMPYNNDAHGTGVAGQMAGTLHDSGGQLYQGVAPGAKIIALRAAGTWAVKQAFDWVVANRAAYNIVGVNYTDQTGSVDQGTIYSDLANLKANGVFVGGPVGNYGGTAYGTYNHMYYQTGSVNLWDGISSFTPGGSNLDFVAPGENVMLDYYYNGSHIDYAGSGTSWSSPQVVGAAALIHQVNPGFTTDQVAAIIRDSGKSVYDARFGMYYSRLDVNAAIKLAFQRAGTGYQGAPAPVVSTPAPVTTAQSPFKGTAFATGTAFKAVDFDNGGEGVSFHDTTGTNEGGTAYRTSGVDMGWTNSEGGTAYVGWTHAGEWMEYTINNATAGSYTFNARAANVGAGAAFHVEIDGVNVSGTMSVSDTGGWDNYANFAKSGIWINAGQHVVKIVMDGNNPYGFSGNYSSFNFSTSAAPVVTTPAPVVTTPATGGGSSTPFSGTPINVGSVIAASNYDNGGEGVAYHDTTGNNEGGAGRAGGVDMGWTNSEGGANYVGWTHAGEWMAYTINAATAGSYNFNTRVANVGSGAAFHVEVDGTNVTGSIAVGNTGSFDAYATLSKSGIWLNAGKHTMKVVMDSNSQYGFSGNFASFQWTGGTAAAAATPTATTVPNGPFGASLQALGGGSAKISFYDNANNETAYVIERAAWNGGAYSVVGTVSVDSATSAGTGLRTWTDSGMAANQNYYYRISAKNALGNSGYTYASGWVS